MVLLMAASQLVENYLHLASTSCQTADIDIQCKGQQPLNTIALSKKCLLLCQASCKCCSSILFLCGVSLKLYMHQATQGKSAMTTAFVSPGLQLLCILKLQLQSQPLCMLFLQHLYSVDVYHCIEWRANLKGIGINCEHAYSYKQIYKACIQQQLVFLVGLDSST